MDLAWALLENKRNEAKAGGGGKTAKKAPSGKSNATGGAGKTKAAKKAPAAKPARRVSAWHCFCKDVRPTLVAGLPLGAQTEQLASQWRGLGPDEKAHFQSQADKASEEKGGAEKGPAKPKGEAGKKGRAVSAYALFSANQRPSVCESLGTRALGPVAKELAARWRALDPGNKQAFEAEAAKANAAR